MSGTEEALRDPGSALRVLKKFGTEGTEKFLETPRSAQNTENQ